MLKALDQLGVRMGQLAIVAVKLMPTEVGGKVAHRQDSLSLGRRLPVGPGWKPVPADHADDGAGKGGVPTFNREKNGDGKEHCRY
jgi:hypothetical protein